MTCQFRFMNSNKRANLGQGVDSGEECVCVGGEGLWELSIPPAQFCCEPETLKKQNKIKSI